MTRLWLCLVLLAALFVARPAAADRVQVFSVQGSDCDNCEDEVGPYLKKAKGVKSWTYDATRSEITVTLADEARDQVVIDAFMRQGCYRAIPGAGRGARAQAHKDEPYPAGADVVVITGKGEAVGPLEKLRVPGKYTVLDFYADWCGPCAKVDKRLREIVAVRKDVAIRKLNVVEFDSALAKQIGRKLRGLPYVVVFAPDGKKTEIIGENQKRLDAALDSRK